MRIFVAGATGAVGKRLVPLLVAAGHQVTATTRTPDKVPDLRARGAEGVLVDGLDMDAVLRAVAAAHPDVIVHRVPAWIGRLAIGDAGLSMMTTARGSSNAKAKRVLGWQCRYPSWRDGFRHGM